MDENDVRWSQILGTPVKVKKMSKKIADNKTEVEHDLTALKANIITKLYSQYLDYLFIYQYPRHIILRCML